MKKLEKFDKSLYMLYFKTPNSKQNGFAINLSYLIKEKGNFKYITSD